MSIPPNKQVRLRFDAQGNFITGFGMGHLEFVGNEKVAVELALSKLDEASIPPVYNPIDITGWTAKWTLKLDVDDADADKKWEVSGSILGLPANGIFLFTVPKASVNFTKQFCYSEFILTPPGVGAEVQVRIPLGVTITKPVSAT